MQSNIALLLAGRMASRPDSQVNKIFVYLLALYAERYQLDVHDLVIVSAH
jgi:hypothetical protein